MPHWSLPLGGRTTIVPFFAPTMLLHMARATKAPRDYGDIHRELLSSLIPAWSNVPFYKPSARSRATAFMWEYDDWTEAKTLITERAELSDSFSPEAIVEVLQRIEQGDGALAEETVLVRALWELSFYDYLQEIAQDVKTTVDALCRIQII